MFLRLRVLVAVQVLVTYVVFLFSPWEVVSSVCTFLFCNTPPTCNHHLQLRLWWASTMHKTQGQTLDKAVIDLGPKDACTGLTFVCLSTAKRLVYLMVDLMSFDRTGNLWKLVDEEGWAAGRGYACTGSTEHEGEVHGHGRLQRRGG